MTGPAKQTLTTEPPVGLVTIGRTVYTVYRLTLTDNSRSAGVVGRYALEGPRGSAFLVTDWGTGYKLNSVSVSRSAAPRPLRDLTREHLAPFGVIVAEGR